MSNLPPVSVYNYPTYLWQMVTDKTGTIFQTLAGNAGPNTAWGVRVWRCPPGQPPQLVYFLENGNGVLYVDDMSKKLNFLATTPDRKPFIVPIDGYIHPVDCPDTTVVNVNESQLASVRQSIATTQAMAQSAQATATNAAGTANDAAAQIATLSRTVASLDARLTAIQNQVNGLLTPSQVADLVWQKIKDINYLYRLAFNAWPTNSPDPDIRAYVTDLVNLIKRVGKG